MSTVEIAKVREAAKQLRSADGSTGLDAAVASWLEDEARSWEAGESVWSECQSLRHAVVVASFAHRQERVALEFEPGNRLVIVTERPES